MSYIVPEWQPGGRHEQFDRGNGEGKYRLFLLLLLGSDEEDILARIQQIPQVQRIALVVQFGVMAQRLWYAVEIQFESRRDPEVKSVIDLLHGWSIDVRADRMLDLWERKD